MRCDTSSYIITWFVNQDKVIKRKTREREIEEERKRKNREIIV